MLTADNCILLVEGNFAVTERANTFWVGHITVRQHAYEILRGEYTLLEDELGLDPAQNAVRVGVYPLSSHENP